ncbi:hypothetical protein [Paraburkholderia sp. RL17-347-BIC-D]|uniref:hypothetical protein n=1 Tax=Paraburkholderia sp. RL17-347-BIC-D TaxID=3031632 RepID=UPI0038BC71EE
METDFYAQLGFHRNPFESNTAEREPEIDQYAIRPPYLDRVQEAARSLGTYTLCGSRGSGKSATRITVQRNLWKETAGRPLTVVLTNFSVFRQHVGKDTSLGLYANQVFYLTIEATLAWLSSFDKGEAESMLKALSKADRAFVDKAIACFYLSRPDNARMASAHECFELLNVSLPRRSQMWVEKKWDSVSSTVVDLASGLAKKYLDFDVGNVDAFKSLLAAQKDAWQSDDPIFIFHKAVEFARLFGFSGLLVQVDKIDETDWTTNDALVAARLIYPIFSNVQLHEIAGLGWSFYLLDRVRSNLNLEEKMSVRWDRLPNETIKWEKSYLRQLVEARLDHFSKKKVTKLADICDGSVDEKNVYDELTQLAAMSPRKLVTILDTVLTNHIQQNQGHFSKLTRQAFDSGMDLYSTKTVQDEFSPSHIEQITKLPSTEFSNKTVSGLFRISQQASSKKIENWIGAGLARTNGQDHSGSKLRPVDKFLVSDPRAARIIERNLQLHG